MLKEQTRKYVEAVDRSGPEPVGLYNCAESTLRAINDYYELGLEEQTLRLAAGWGGGMYTEQSCGIVIAGAAAMASMYAGSESPRSNLKVKATVKAWVKAMRDRFGSANCGRLKELGNCKQLIIDAADVFEEVIKAAEK